MKLQEWSWLDVSWHARWEFLHVDKQSGPALKKKRVRTTNLLVGEDYDKTTRALKEGFGATLKASFAGWDTPDRYRRWNKLDFSELKKKKQKAHVFFARNVPRKFQNCSEFNKQVDSFPAESAQISRKSTQIGKFLNCCGSCMWQIAGKIAACRNGYFCICMLQPHEFQI